MNGGQPGVRRIGWKVGQRCQRELAAQHGASDFFQRADFGRGQPEPRQPRCAGAQDDRRRERIEGLGEPSPDRRGAGGRKLLRHDDGGQAGEAIGPPPQRRSSSRRHQRGEPWIGAAERGESNVEIGVGMDVGLRHDIRSLPARSSHRGAARLCE